MKLRRRSSAPEPPTTASCVQDAWRILEITIGWIKFADTKAAASLTASGVVGAILLESATQPGSSHGSRGAVLLAVLAGVALLSSSVLSVSTLAPRSTPEGKDSILYFGHVASEFNSTPDVYSAELAALLTDRRAQFAEISRQIVANSSIARAKYNATKWAIWLLFAGVVLAAAAWSVSAL